MADIQLNSVTLATESGGTVVLDSATSLSGVTIPAAGITGTLPNAVQDNITRLGTVTAGNISNTAIVFPAGHIIQTKALSHNYTQAITGTTNETDMQESSGTTWEPSITVTSGNKVLIFITANLKGNNGSGADARAHFRLYQKIGSGSYALLVKNGESIGGYDYGGSGIWIKVPHSTNFLSSPNSGDLIKYKITLQPPNTAASIAVNDAGDDITHIILQEVQV